MDINNNSLKIVNRLRGVVDFLRDANKLFNQNIALNMALEECIEDLTQNTAYLTMCAEGYDFNCREHNVNMKYIQGRCEGVISFLHYFRNMTDDQCVYFLINKTEEMLAEIIGLINCELPTERLCQSDKKNKEQTE